MLEQRGNFTLWQKGRVWIYWVSEVLLYWFTKYNPKNFWCYLLRDSGKPPVVTEFD